LLGRWRRIEANALQREHATLSGHLPRRVRSRQEVVRQRWFFDKSQIFRDQGIVASVRFWADAHHHDW
jgi:hypothetical protein